MINLDGVIGWFNFSFYYDSIITSLPPNSRIMEIGVFYGRSTCYLADLIRTSGKQIEFHCCDIFEVRNKFFLRIDNLTFNQNFRHKFEENLLSFGLSSYVQIHEGESHNVLAGFPDNYFDFIFVDGEHDYQFVKRDVAIGIKKVKYGGRLAGHDAHTNAVLYSLRDANLNYKYIGAWENRPDLPLLWEVNKIKLG